MSQPVFLFIIVIIEITFCQIVDIGDSCFLEPTSRERVCKLSGNCPAALKNDSYSLQKYSCGRDDGKFLVCCSPTPPFPPGQISKQKCKEFLQHNRKNKVKRSTKGIPTAFGEYPHMAAVGYGDLEDVKWNCGGSLISDWFVLTAAHCLDRGNLGGATYVKIGIINLTDTGDLVQIIPIAKQIQYPKYRPTSFYHDIGLIKLERAARFLPHIRPACLYQKKTIFVPKAIATGWGSTRARAIGSDRLLYCNITLLDYQSCKDFYKPQDGIKNGIIDEIQFCAGAKKEGVDTCQGDSGGPFQIHLFGTKKENVYDIIGITSFGQFCYISPGVYTRVSYYIKWIEDNVWPQRHFTINTQDCSCNVKTS